MPTPIDRALQSRNAFLGFAGIIGVVAAWSIWGGGDMFPKEPTPTGAIQDPKGWTETEMKRWLHARGLKASDRDTREELLARIDANMATPRT